MEQKNVEAQQEARHGMDEAVARQGWHSLLTTSVLQPEDEEAWEKRAEALWRMRQWGPIEGTQSHGFHGSIHSALSGLSSAVHALESTVQADRPLAASASHDFSQAVAAVERPLLKMVADAATEIQVQSAEHLQRKAMQLQMLGAIFQCSDALVTDVHKKSQGNGSQTRNVVNLASTWTSNARVRCPVEPLLALQSSLLATTMHPLAEVRFLTMQAAMAREADSAHLGLLLLERAQRVGHAKLQRQDWGRWTRLPSKQD